MNRLVNSLIAVLAVWMYDPHCGSLQSAHAASNTTAPSEAGLSIHVEWDKMREGRVGGEVQLSLQLVNHTPHRIALPTRQEGFGDRITMTARGTVIGDSSESSDDTLIPDGELSVNFPPKREDFEELEPGRASRIIDRKFVPLVPGDFQINICFRNDTAAFEEVLDGHRKTVSQPNVWTGVASKTITLHVSSKPLPEFEQQTAMAAAVLAQAASSPEERRATLRSIAREKHYFAARFIWKTWRETAEPAVKLLALDELIGLLEFGTAYEALPDMLALLKDEHTPREFRGRLLAIIDKMNPTSDHPRLLIADQATYEPPKALKKEILAVIQGLSTSSNPYVAGQAKAILKKDK